MGRLSAAQTEQLKAIVSDLRHQRQQAGVSLEEVAVKTYIPLRVLQALEAVDTDRLPEPVFVQGFIKRYGDILGLNGTAISKTFSAESEAVKLENVNLHSAAKSSTPASNPNRNSASSSKPSAKPGTSSAPQVLLTSSQPTPAYLLAGVLGLGLIGGLLYWVVPPLLSAKQGQPEQAPEATTSQPVPQRTTIPTATTPKPTAVPQPKAIKTIEAVLNLTDECWLQVEVDGKLVYEGILEKGAQRSWQAKRDIVLSAGNAGAVIAAFNGKKALPFGRPGGVKTARISQRGVQVLQEQ